MESRIKQLREKRGLIQDILATELGITQQMLSKYERDITLIKVDVLKRIAAFTWSFRYKEGFATANENQ